MLSPGSSTTLFGNLAHSHNTCRKELCGRPDSLPEENQKFIFCFSLFLKRKNCKKIFSEMRGRLYFVLPWPSLFTSPAGSSESLVPVAAGHPVYSWDKHRPPSARGEQSVCACHKSVTLFSTAAAICCSLYPSCIFCAVGSSSKAVMICNETELAGSLSPAHTAVGQLSSTHSGEPQAGIRRAQDYSGQVVINLKLTTKQVF